jgi:hypothetical protein
VKVYSVRVCVCAHACVCMFMHADVGSCVGSFLFFHESERKLGVNMVKRNEKFFRYLAVEHGLQYILQFRRNKNYIKLT